MKSILLYIGAAGTVACGIMLVARWLYPATFSTTLVTATAFVSIALLGTHMFLYGR